MTKKNEMTWAEEAMIIRVPIQAPEDWTPEKDLQEYVDRFGESKNLRGDSIAKMLEGYRRLDRTLTNGLIYFLNKSGNDSDQFVGALSIQEKVAWMIELVRKHAKNFDYLNRFSAVLWDCRLVDLERNRILRACCHPGLRSDDPGYCYPIYDMADALAGARILLDEALRCENDDYAESVGEDLE